MVSSKSKWEAFFKDAGIPTRQAVEYAAIFYDNRMRLDMLDELNKEVLRDLGIKALGDVIAILRYGKQKYAEMNRSPSPEVVETTISGSSSGIKSTPITEKVKSLEKTAVSKPLGIKPSVSNVKHGKLMANTSTSPFKITSFQKGNIQKNKPITINSNLKSINTTKDKITIGNTMMTKTSESIKSKSTSRLTLSQRFGEFETETKRKKVEEEKMATASDTELEFIPISRAAQPANPLLPPKLKSKGTMFTIQLPSKLPITVSDATKPKQKVTVVPALGKALNRSKHTASIFDRLDAPSSSSTAISLVNKDESPNQKKNVFNRLGTRGDKNSDNVQIVTGIVRDADSTKSSKSVFNRLGDN